MCQQDTKAALTNRCPNRKKIKTNMKTMAIH